MAEKANIQDPKFPKELLVSVFPALLEFTRPPSKPLTGILVLVTFGRYGDEDVHVEHPLFLRVEGKQGHNRYLFERRGFYAI